MRVVVQRVSRASIRIDHQEGESMKQGIVVLAGFENSDTSEDLDWIGRKLLNLRIFDDEEGIMNRSVEEVNGSILIVSQFTLHASTRKGNRPSYIKAAKPDIAIPLYEEFVAKLVASTRLKIHTGNFGSYMEIELVNDGPVTISMDTKNKE